MSLFDMRFEGHSTWRPDLCAWTPEISTLLW